MITPLHDSGNFFWQALTVILLPLLAFGIASFIRTAYAWLAPIISSLLMLASFVMALLLLIQIESNTYHFTVPWLLVGQQQISITLLLNKTTTVMLMVVSCISLLVHLYSIGYMSDDARLKTYFGLLGFFTFSMMGLVLSTNLLIIFFFWELVGYSSYRLIGFWQTKPEAAQAATKSFLINRVADVFFLLGILMLYASGSLEVTTLVALPPDVYRTVAIICIFIGVMGKSAQFPFFTWLPDAMQGPTPVSALLHAATMVAAGIFVLIQLQPAITADAAWFMTIIGVTSAAVGGVGALFQYDIKKILAYSTMSQLGLMIVAIGTNNMEGANLHLLNHAFFKAGLFLLAGYFIHSQHHQTQDIRQLNVGSNKFIVISWLICAASLAAIPFTAGFVSKEIILSGILDATPLTTFHVLVGALVLLINVITVIYTFRLWWYVQGPATAHHVAPAVMRLPIIILALASLAIISSLAPIHFAGWMNIWIHPTTQATLLVTVLSLFAILIGIGISWRLYRQRPSVDYPVVVTSKFLFIDQFYSLFLIKPVLAMAQWTVTLDQRIIDGILHRLSFVTVTFAHISNWLDRFLIDKVVVEGAAHITRLTGRMARSLVSGKIQYYLLWALALLLSYIIMLLYF